MTAAEEGVLLLCCRLGDPNCKPLTMAQFRDLGLRVRASRMDGDPLEVLSERILCQLGYEQDEAARIIALLERKEQLHRYLVRADALDIFPLTRISTHYPHRIRQHIQFSCPPVLFGRGDRTLLDMPSVAVIGSRHLLPENAGFAAEAGRIAAKEGFVLVSGGATGADLTAQNACLEAGGSCVIFVPDRLTDHPRSPRCLFISEDGYDLPFSPARALHRNRLIHMQGDKTIAAQCTYGKGGTWEGCLDNLKHNWSPLFVFEDGSHGTIGLIERGASGIQTLSSILQLKPVQTALF